MKKDQIGIGGTYLAKVSNNVVPVRIDSTNPHGGWDATNLVTHKKVRIKTAQRLRGPAPAYPCARRAQAIAAVQAADAAANAHAVPAHAVPAEATPAKATPAEAEKTAGRMSGLDAAFEVLKAKGEPMTCSAIVTEVLAKGMWKTAGKTPANTTHSAIAREISTKGEDARFKKTDRGLFTINAK